MSKAPTLTSFQKVAECLYRNESSGGYYALVKKSGKQIRRSLKTKDRKLAERRLRDFREQLTGLDFSKGKAKLNFETLRGLDIRYQEAAKLVELLAYSGMRKTYGHLRDTHSFEMAKLMTQ